MQTQDNIRMTASYRKIDVDLYDEDRARPYSLG